MDKLKIFQDKQIRSYWDADKELWFFSIIDIIAILTGSDRPRKYWNDLKLKLVKEGSQLSEEIGQLKMKSTDGKSYLTDVADTQALFRLIQSIPSPKAEIQIEAHLYQSMIIILLILVNSNSSSLYKFKS